MIRVKAYAKINLGLRIIRRRDDGYHDIETIFHRINLFDELSLTPSSTISMSCGQSGLPTDDRNLCIRAAELIAQRCGMQAGVHIDLTKTIPIGAGLGGGSSDAAATLSGLHQLWNLRMSDTELSAIAVQLGSDVPYFMRGGSAYATARGDVLDYFRLNLPYWILVVYPNLHVSTAWAYQEFKSQNSKFKISLKSAVLDHINEPQKLRQLVVNDFETIVVHTHEPVARARDALIGSGAEFVQLSGSGSSVYGLFRDEDTARNAEKICRRHTAVFMTPPHFQPSTVGLPSTQR